MNYDYILQLDVDNETHASIIANALICNGASFKFEWIDLPNHSDDDIRPPQFIRIKVLAQDV